MLTSDGPGNEREQVLEHDAGETSAGLRGFISDAVVTIDPARVVLELNPAAERVCRRTRAVAAGGSPARLVGPATWQAVQPVLDEPPAIRHAMVRGDDRERIPSLTVLPVRAADGTRRGSTLIERVAARADQAPEDSGPHTAAALLRRIGVDFAQGFHLGRPRPVVPQPAFDGIT